MDPSLYYKLQAVTHSKVSDNPESLNRSVEWYGPLNAVQHRDAQPLKTVFCVKTEAADRSFSVIQRIIGPGCFCRNANGLEKQF